MKKIFRRFLFVLLFLLILAAAALYFIPLQDIATRKIKTALGERGIKISSLDIIHFDEQQASLSNIKIGDDPTLNIKQVDAKYFYKDLIKGKFKSVDIKGIEANIYRKDNVWAVGGLEELLKPQPKTEETKTAIDVAKLQGFIQPVINITESKISAQEKDLQIAIPFDFNLANSADKIEGKFTSKELTTSGLPYAIPPMDLAINYKLSAKEITANIKAHDKAGDYKSDIDINAPSADIMGGNIVINHIAFPYGGGTVSAKNVKVPLNRTKPINIALNLQNIDLAQLLGAVSDGAIGGTGKISGTIPLTYYPDGKITIQKGSAQAGDNGTLTVSPEMLPGDNAELIIARETLKNFHYTTLKIGVSSNEKEQSVIAFSVEGKNPDANNGRPVKLNVNVSGDVIPLIQQSLLAINDVKQLLHIEETQ